MTPNRAAQERAEASGRVLSVAADGRIILPWSRQLGESHQAFEAFEVYRASVVRGRRSIRGTAAKLGKSRQLLERWSVRWRWGARCEQFDRAVARLRLARHMAEISEQAVQLAQVRETTSYTAVRRALAELDKLLSDRDFMLSAALTLPLEDLVNLVGGPSVPLPGGLGKRGAETALKHENAPTHRWAEGWAEGQQATP
jgi:hypothetical protein